MALFSADDGFQKEGKNMRRHIMRLRKLLRVLGATVLVVLVVSSVWSLASTLQPSEAVPDSIAATLPWWRM